MVWLATRRLTGMFGLTAIGIAARAVTYRTAVRLYLKTRGVLGKSATRLSVQPAAHGLPPCQTRRSFRQRSRVPDIAHGPAIDPWSCLANRKHEPHNAGRPIVAALQLIAGFGRSLACEPEYLHQAHESIERLSFGTLGVRAAWPEAEFRAVFRFRHFVPTPATWLALGSSWSAPLQ